MVERQAPAVLAAVDAAPAVPGEQGPSRDLPLDGARHSNIGEEADHMRPGIRVARRAQGLSKLLDHLGLALEDEYVRTSDRADVQWLIARVQDKNVRHWRKITNPTRIRMRASAMRRRSRATPGGRLTDAKNGRRPREKPAPSTSDLPFVCKEGEPGVPPCSPGHCPFYGFLFLRRELDRGAALLELLDVDAGVIAALDRAHHDPRAPRVEKGQRRRLLPAGARVRVVPDDGRVRDAAVDPAVDPHEAGRDLVHGAVEVVDTRLQRDGELDEILLRAAEQDCLRTAQTPDLDEEDDPQDDGGESGGPGSERDPRRR